IFVKHMTAYEFFTLLEFRRVLFRSVPLQIGIALLERGPSAPLRELGDQRPDPLRRRRDRHRAAERVTAHRLLPCGLGPLPARLVQRTRLSCPPRAICPECLVLADQSSGIADWMRETYGYPMRVASPWADRKRPEA